MNIKFQPILAPHCTVDVGQGTCQIVGFGMALVLVYDFVFDYDYDDERRSMRVAYNAIYRRLFGYRHFESVTNLQHSLGRKTWEELVELRQNSFLFRAKQFDNESLVWVLAHRL